MDLNYEYNSLMEQDEEYLEFSAQDVLTGDIDEIPYNVIELAKKIINADENSIVNLFKKPKKADDSYSLHLNELISSDNGFELVNASLFIMNVLGRKYESEINAKEVAFQLSYLLDPEYEDTGDEKYHCYIYFDPTKNKAIKRYSVDINDYQMESVLRLIGKN